MILTQETLYMRDMCEIYNCVSKTIERRVARGELPRPDNNIDSDGNRIGRNLYWFKSSLALHSPNLFSLPIVHTPNLNTSPLSQSSR